MKKKKYIEWEWQRTGKHTEWIKKRRYVGLWIDMHDLRWEQHESHKFYCSNKMSIQQNDDNDDAPKELAVQ